jgi:mono/diheme cytochrome c family protein
MWIVVLTTALSGCGGSSEGSPLAEGKAIYAELCSVCHGSTGDGGVGPALDEVAVTWPSCADQIAWIRLGSDGWRAEFGDTYGATDKPVEGGMPAQSENLLESEIVAVAAFERATYGGVDEARALAECGVTTETGQARRPVDPS